jgi:hypothetical protein
VAVPLVVHLEHAAHLEGRLARGHGVDHRTPVEARGARAPALPPAPASSAPRAQGDRAAAPASRTTRRPRLVPRRRSTAAASTATPPTGPSGPRSHPSGLTLSVHLVLLATAAPYRGSPR